MLTDEVKASAFDDAIQELNEWQRSSGFIYRYPNGGGLAYADPDGQGRAQLRCLVDCDGDTKETVIILPDHLRIFERIQRSQPAAQE